MGSYLNPGPGMFQMALGSEIYVDKTEMITYLNSIVRTEQNCVSISRPRRFGKSMAANMLCAYYGKGDSRELFEERKLSGHENWDKYLNQFDVIRIVMTEFIKSGKPVEESLEKMQKLIVRDLCRQYLDVDYFDTDDLIQSMKDVFAEKGAAFVIIIDEWDAVFRERKEDKAGQELYLDFLRDWLKDKEYVALAYMTGILPIKKYGKHSALNMFREFSIINPRQLAACTGFTEDEVKELCKKYGRDYEKIRDWYDGYVVSDVIPPDEGYALLKSTGEGPKAKHYSIYSPLSVVEAVSSGQIMNYWNKTENYEALAEYIRMDYDGLKEAVALLMDGGSVETDISTYQNDMTSFHNRDDVLTMLIHLGYLRYDLETGTVVIPNNEIKDEFKTSTRSEEWVETFRSFKKSQELLAATWEENTDKIAELLEWFHDSAENRTCNSEAALSYAIQMAYYAAQKYYTAIQELDSGKGSTTSGGRWSGRTGAKRRHADLVYLPSPKYPDKPVLLIELKYDKSLETAADQIRKKNYLQKLAHYQGHILLISINYEKDLSSTDENYKHHSCKIERV
ncbi:MAG: AAA family ATPase [Lachnospiraceae bacterium]|nr:AAA family ATPase [Lachnospiraceae bacterium]